MTSNQRRAVLALAAGALLPAVSRAETYPSRAIRLVVPWPAGGPSDVVGRELAEGLARRLGQPVVVDNKGGANGLPGADAVAKSPPDGYTLMFHNLTSHVTNPWVYKKLPYDTVADFAPITLVSSSSLLIASNPGFAPRTMAELIAAAKARPGEITIASFGSGSMGHLGIELLKSMAGIDVNHIPYKGGAPAVSDTLAGHTQVCIVGFPVALQQVQSGKLRGLGVTTPTRSRQLPDVPAVAETPGLAGYDASLKYGLWAPTKTPAAILARLHEAAVAVIADAGFKARVLQQGMDEVASSTPEQMAATVRTDLDRIGRLVRAAGLEPE